MKDVSLKKGRKKSARDSSALGSSGALLCPPSLSLSPFSSRACLKVSATLPLLPGRRNGELAVPSRALVFRRKGVARLTLRARAAKSRPFHSTSARAPSCFYLRSSLAIWGSWKRRKKERKRRIKTVSWTNLTPKFLQRIHEGCKKPVSFCLFVVFEPDGLKDNSSSQQLLRGRVSMFAVPCRGFSNRVAAAAAAGGGGGLWL